MPKKAIILIAEGLNGERELARELGMNEAELSQKLEDMCRKGYLKIVDSDKCMCAAGPNMRDDSGVRRTFSLTEKGKKLIG